MSLDYNNPIGLTYIPGVKGRLSMKKTVVAFLFLQLFFAIEAVPQMSQQSLELGCPHLYPIQAKYLEKHINYAKEDKNLESRTVDQFIKRLDASKLYLLEPD